jgi:hypothetical protein
VIHDTKRIRIRQSRNETNLFGVRIRDYDTKPIHVFTNLLYDSRILTFFPFLVKNRSFLFQILEKSLRILFETKDVSLVKRFVQRQFGKISAGKIPLQDLTFAREFRGMAGYRPNACVPALELSK